MDNFSPSRTSNKHGRPSPSNQIAEVAGEILELGMLAPVALEVGMLTGDAGSLHSPGSLPVANMSLSTLSRAIVQV
ncbi:hypothetical protein TRIUR3_20570 [Triticum urartu]|uniref:Uncharacterized protein n=1 Tax=Triticum urartu TaxID=4572 RepID=M7YSH8_TRIUA|nr:hypothetical protein TRIUR3_20570 [Triticum urartu]